MVVFTTALSFSFDLYVWIYEDEASSVPAEDKKQKLLLKKKQLELFQHLFKDETIISPIVGSTVALADVNDPVFSSGSDGTRNCYQTN